MQQFKLTLKPESYLSTATGSGDPLLDIDVLFDEYGLPYINGKRIKGLLRESMREVLEIQGIRNVDDIIGNTFGIGDRFSGQPLLSDIPNMRMVLAADFDALELSKCDKDQQAALSPNFIKNYFTTIRTVTAVEKNGIAKNKSLRSVRVVKPSLPDREVQFSTILTAHNDLDEVIIKYLKQAVNNLRYAGTSRNRGFGKVKCCLTEIENSPIKNKLNVEESIEALQVSITTLGPIVLPQISGDQNTVNTAEEINGSLIRGILAYKYLENRKIDSESAHNDHGFKKIFLSGKVLFGHCTLNHSHKLGLHIHEYKATPGHLINVFSRDPDKETEAQRSRVTKSVNEYAIIRGNSIVPRQIKKTLHFHNSRLERRAGRSTENNPGIYHYESIDSGQTFIGTIHSEDPTILKEIIDGTGAEFNAKAGKSKSVQYGNVRVEISGTPKKDTLKTHKGRVQVILKSPLILENKWGHVTPCAETLSTALFNQDGILPEYAAARTTQVEMYNRLWQSKSRKCEAYAAGSVFVYDLKKETSINKYAGLWTDTGYWSIEISDYGIQESSYTLSHSGNGTRKEGEGLALPKHFQDIVTKYKKDKQRNILLAKAVEEAEIFGKKLDNSPLMRLHSLLKITDSAEAWLELFEPRGELKGLKEKPLGKKLIGAGLYLSVVNLTINNKGCSNGEFKEHQMFWLKKLQTATKFRKLMDQQKKAINE